MNLTSKQVKEKLKLRDKAVSRFGLKMAQANKSFHVKLSQNLDSFNIPLSKEFVQYLPPDTYLKRLTRRFRQLEQVGAARGYVMDMESWARDYSWRWEKE